MTQKLLLTAAGIGIFLVSGAWAQTTESDGKPLEFEIASVKPSAPESRGTMINIGNGMLVVKNATVKHLIAMCYDLRDFQITGGPGWIATDHFDLEAKSEAMASSWDPKAMTDAKRRTEYERQFKERTRSLLADRFQLSAHKETKEMPIYALVQAKGGSKLQPPKDEPGGNRGMRMQRGVLTGMSATVEMLANAMADQAGRPVIDKTGLQGTFDWKLEWTPDPGQMQPQGQGPGAGAGPGQGPGAGGAAATPPPDISGPSIFTALQEQLGLKLESQKGPAPILVIDRVEKPSAN